MRHLCTVTLSLGLGLGLALTLTACGGGGDAAPPVPLQPATFDMTGTWVAQISGGASNPAGNEDQDGAAQVVVTQTGNDVTVSVVGDAVVYTGAVSGADYQVTTTQVEPDGSTDEVIEFTLSSADAGNGTVEWLFTGQGGPISGGSNLALARVVAPTFDMTGTWDVTSSGNFSSPPGNEEANETTSVAVTQTGGTVEMTIDGEVRTGFVSGADYFVEYEVDEGGGADTAVFIAFTLSSSTTGAGTVGWRYENGSVITGGANLALSKP